MLPYDDSRATKIGLFLFFLCVLGYAYFETRGYINGPLITFKTTLTESPEQFIEIEGVAERIQSITMNGKTIAVTPKGEFKEPYLLASGDNKIYFDAKDKYEHATRAIFEVYYTPTTTIKRTLPTATTSGSSSTTTARTATSTSATSTATKTASTTKQ